MDSGNEVIIVDDSIVTTNGINGNHEEISEMKTRSKVGDDESVKSKLRARTIPVTVQKNSDEKVNSDSEKKDKKKEVATTRIAQPDSKPTGTSSSVTVKKGKTGEEEKSAPTPAKKKVSEREDDSGINSRASSVSNEDTVAPRMRTRSSRTSEIPSTSTPAYKRGQGRMPISVYEFDDSTFDDDLSTNSLKRKAILYIEEMDDPEEGMEENGEPAPKRPSPIERTNRFVSTLFYPLWVIRNKFTFGRQTEKLGTPETDADVVKTNGDGAEMEKTEDAEISTSPTDRILATEDVNASSTCRVM